ncbi:MAG: MATE family efflux transporter [Simkaniaceae bacterium]|nr:MATE family efflux transporter [Candidatus Sacchlamyda saccharinae]
MKAYNYLESPVGKTLFYKSLPMFLGIFANIAYNLVDTFFVARLGTQELAAMSFGFPIIMIVLNIMMGIATALSSLSSRLIGQKKLSEAKETNSQGLLFTFIVSVFLTILGMLTINPLFKLLGVESAVMGYVHSYMSVWYCGMLLMNLNIVGGAIFRAKGNVTYPSLILVLGAALNAILDPILIFGLGPIPAMGIAGAAWTTVFGNGLSTLLIFAKLLKDDEISLPSMLRSINFSIHKRISVIAFPTAMANSFVPMSTAFTNWLLVSYGNAAVAANSIATRIETVPFMAIFALSSVLAPFIGQNWGAGNLSRIREGIKKSFVFSYLLGAACALSLIFFRKSIGALFDNSPQVVDITALYFSFIPLTYGMLGTVFLTNNAMNAVGKPYLGNLLSASRLVLLYIPLAYLLNRNFEINGIFFARVAANLIVGALSSLLIYRTFFHKEPAPEEIS